MLSSLAQELLNNDNPENAETGGYDFDFVGDIDSEYECCICLHVLQDPYQIVPCGHRCCRSCLGALFRKFGDKTICPIDRGKLAIERIFPDNSCKRKIVNMKIRCKEVATGCDWQGELHKYDEHTSYCLYVSVHCSSKGCTELLLRKDKDQHEDSCMWRVVQCDKCQENVHAYELEDHKRDTCQHENVPCTNGCLFYLPRFQMSQHISSACPETVVKCPLELLGCIEQVPRKQLQMHLEGSQIEHLEMVVSMKKELDRLKAQVKKIPASDEYDHFIWSAPPVYEIISLGEINSAPYSTGPRGYCFTIAIKRRENDTVLSIKLVPGFYDDLLPWPFRCNFSIVLLDQHGGGPRCHLKKQVDFSDFASDSQVPQLYHRPIYGEERSVVYPLLTILNDTLDEQRYSPNGVAMILVKIKRYNCEENLDV